MLCTRSNGRHRRPPANCNKIAAPPEIAGLLLPAERVVSEAVVVHGWRYEAAEVPYERRTLMVGGPVLFALTGIGSAIRNRSARKAAEAQAAPRWRPLGPLTVLATTDRLLVWYQDTWRSVWYSAITSSSCEARRLELTFADDAPYLLCGNVQPLGAGVDASLAGT